ncbi:MAG: DEAD/DEAH box helicase [Candidatus Woesearchaeota archaeon]
MYYELKEFTPRLYQQTIFDTATKKNTLVVLPTGMGKTAIFLMMALHRLKTHPNSKILFLGPTRPLIDQYYSVFVRHTNIPQDEMAIFTGFVSPEKRKSLFEKCKVIFSTPQGLENDILTGKISLKSVSLLGVDEAHRATGDYSYVFIAKQYHKRADNGRILALTASPGSEMEKIMEVCNNLFIEDIEIRTHDSPDVREYVNEIDIKKIIVELPEEIKHIQRYLFDCYKSKLEEVKKLGYLHGNIVNYNKTNIIAIQGQLHGMLARGEKDFNLMRSISLLAEALKVQHALELAETQNLDTLWQYFLKLQSEAAVGKVKAVQNLVRDINFRSALIKTQITIDKNVDNPKLEELKKLVIKEYIQDKNIKIIVFSQYRDSGQKITETLKQAGINAKLFVGQQKKKETGMSQKDQKKTLDEFREGKFNVLVSSSVGEEGLDIPQVDIVIFFEPVPSAIRKIQRIGRTGRLEKGRVIIFMSKGTRDEIYHYVASAKERRMYRVIEQLKKNFRKGITDINVNEKKENLNKFFNEEQQLTIYADFREKGSGIINKLSDLGIKINMEKLDVADYVLSKRVAVEFKTKEDFVNSIIDGRLLQQMKSLRKYEKPLLIIQGEEDIYSIRKVHQNSILGMLATISIDFAIPILFTKNYIESARLIAVIAKREADEDERGFTLHTAKPLTIKEQQEYVVSSFPGIGAELNKPLLKKFKSIKKIVNASGEQLQSIEQIGPKKAKTLKELFEKEYE